MREKGDAGDPVAFEKEVHFGFLGLAFEVKGVGEVLVVDGGVCLDVPCSDDVAFGGEEGYVCLGQSELVGHGCYGGFGVGWGLYIEGDCVVLHGVTALS